MIDDDLPADLDFHDAPDYLASGPRSVDEAVTISYLDPSGIRIVEDFLTSLSPPAADHLGDASP